MVCVYQYNCVISILPKHELQICPNDMKMHWKHWVFDSPQTGRRLWCSFVSHVDVAWKHHAQKM